MKWAVPTRHNNLARARTKTSSQLQISQHRNALFIRFCTGAALVRNMLFSNRAWTFQICFCRQLLTRTEWQWASSIAVKSRYRQFWTYSDASVLWSGCIQIIHRIAHANLIGSGFNRGKQFLPGACYRSIHLKSLIVGTPNLHRGKSLANRLHIMPVCLQFISYGIRIEQLSTSFYCALRVVAELLSFQSMIWWEVPHRIFSSVFMIGNDNENAVEN